ncbi:MAG TPA: carboxylesterase family protein [Polyangiales bacterium]|nr:carboxylesterase family protein [Polyangiales bacterium]
MALIGLGASARAQTVTTPAGVTYRGASANGVTSFKGIRYAAAPTGERRWAPPYAPEPGGSELDARAFGSACPQIESPFGPASVNEDCLFLNVFVPGNVSSRARLPVLVFFHGGAFISGSSESYDPTSLVLQNETIVVTVNYRLGTLGYMAAPLLSASDRRGVSGNYGLLDQQFALGWVKQNIAAFGGDPREVTISGESAGGFSVCALLVAPSANGLFRRALSESGPCSFPLPTREQAEAKGQEFVQAVGCASDSAAEGAACLRQLSVEAVLANQTPTSELLGSPTGLTEFFPNVDGQLLPQQPMSAIALGAFNRVPIVLGTNRNEGTLFVALAFDLLNGQPLSAEQYPQQLERTAQAVLAQASSQFGSESNPSGSSTQLLAAQLEHEYPLRDYDTPGEALAAVITDGTFACPAYISQQLLSLFTPTYAYEFADRSAPMPFLPPVSFPYGAAHTTELPYLFDNLAQLRSDQSRLARSMRGYWTKFAATGSPIDLGQPLWPLFTIATPLTQSFAGSLPRTDATFALDHHCLFWSSLLVQGSVLSVLRQAGG